MLLQNCNRSRNTIEDILDENREACDCPTDCQVNNTVKAQKNMKDISKIVHLRFYRKVKKLREYVLYAKKT